MYNTIKNYLGRLFGGGKAPATEQHRNKPARARHSTADREGKYIVRVEGRTARIIEKKSLVDTSSVDDKCVTPESNILTEGGIISKNEPDPAAVREALHKIAMESGMNVYYPPRSD